MYQAFYGLREEPFGSTPDPRFLFASAMHREAMASMQYCIEAGRGFFALIAPPGMGKTTLLFQALEKYHDTASTAFLFNTQCTSREFIRFLLSEVGIEDEIDDVVRLHRRFNEFLLANSRLGRRFILIVDEAQNLSNEVLETIRLLSDFETSRAKLMQIVLAGQPELDATLKQPGMSQLLQRISMISRIEPLSVEETGNYINHRLGFAGYRGEPIFGDRAIEMIARYSHGIPRLINSICFNALSLGFAAEHKKIDVDLIAEAVADLPYTHGEELPLRNTAPVPIPVATPTRPVVPSETRGMVWPAAPIVVVPAATFVSQPVQAKASAIEKSPTDAPGSSTAQSPIPSPGILKPVPEISIAKPAAPQPPPAVRSNLSATQTPTTLPTDPAQPSSVKPYTLPLTADGIGKDKPAVVADPKRTVSPAVVPIAPQPVAKAPGIEKFPVLPAAKNTPSPVTPPPSATAFNSSAIPTPISQSTRTTDRTKPSSVRPDPPPFVKNAQARSNRRGSSLGNVILALLVLVGGATAGYLVVRHRTAASTTGQIESVNAASPSAVTPTVAVPNSPIPTPPPGKTGDVSQPVSVDESSRKLRANGLQETTASAARLAEGSSGQQAAEPSKNKPVAVPVAPWSAHPAPVKSPTPASRVSETTRSASGHSANLIASTKKAPVVASLNRSNPPLKSAEAVVVPPKFIKGIPPEYPPMAKNTLAEGDVVLTATVNEHGTPENLKWVKGGQVFKEAAFNAVRQWKYRPGTYNGKTAGMPVEIHFKFSHWDYKQNIDQREGRE